MSNLTIRWMTSIISSNISKQQANLRYKIIGQIEKVGAHYVDWRVTSIAVYSITFFWESQRAFSGHELVAVGQLWLPISSSVEKETPLGLQALGTKNVFPKCHFDTTKRDVLGS